MERSKDKQEHIYFMAAPSRQEAESSPFVERLLRKGYEVLYMVDPVDEYTVQVCGGVSGHIHFVGGVTAHLGAWHGMRCYITCSYSGLARV